MAAALPLISTTTITAAIRFRRYRQFVFGRPREIGSLSPGRASGFQPPERSIWSRRSRWGTCSKLGGIVFLWKRVEFHAPPPFLAGRTLYMVLSRLMVRESIWRMD